MLGDLAPDFELPDQSGQPVRLSDYAGKKAVVLVFYPLTFTGVCREELTAIRDAIADFRNDRVETLAVSVDSAPVHRRWAEQEGFDFAILADFWPHGEVAARYGVLDQERGVAASATFIIDTDGVIRHREVGTIGQPRDLATWRRVLADL